MKKTVLLFMFALLTVAVSASEKVKRDDDVKVVSYSVKRQFESEFKDASDVVWTATDRYQKASFTLNGKKATAFYNQHGEFLGATQFVTYDEIPAEAKNQIASEYHDYQAAEVVKVISRPEYSEQNDVGAYWVQLVSDKKQVCLKVRASVDVQLINENLLAKQ